MGKLHELLAIEPELKAEAQRVISRAKSTFTEGKGRFTGRVHTYQPLAEGGEREPEEITELATSVEAELVGLEVAYGAWIDAAMQKEVTNQGTMADLAIGAEVEDLPATALLNLESKLAELRAVYQFIPTNDPAVSWDVDEQLGCFVSQPRTVFRSKKVPRSHILYEATVEHPAQVEMYHEDIRVGQFTTIVHSGALTPRDKQERLKRISELIRTVKQARMRANCAEVVDVHIAKKIFDYINSG